MQHTLHFTTRPHPFLPRRIKENVLLYVTVLLRAEIGLDFKTPRLPKPTWLKEAAEILSESDARQLPPKRP
jgi:hypothetical protein